MCDFQNASYCPSAESCTNCKTLFTNIVRWMWDLKTLTLSIPEGTRSGGTQRVSKKTFEVKQASFTFYSKGKMVINVIAPRATTSGVIVKDIFEDT